MKFIAFTTKGLEQVAREEIQEKLDNVSMEEVADKRIVFETSSSYQSLITLKTVDDIGAITDIDNLSEIKNWLGTHRKINNSFSITLSQVGKEISASDISNQIKKPMKELGFNYTEFDHSNFDIRIFIDKTEIYLAVRLSPLSLQHRSYKSLFKPGSLKPTIAAAMVFLCVDGAVGYKIVDTFCGSGTILCEAHNQGCLVFGGDIDS